MCRGTTLQALLLTALLIPGCSQGTKTQSEADVSRGDQELAEFDAQQRVENATDNDYSKMTQVDPNLKKEAMADFDQAIQDDPTSAEAYYARGYAYLSHGNAMLTSIEDFTKAIELKPDYARAYLMRGRAYEALGDRKKSEADRNKALELEPGID